MEAEVLGGMTEVEVFDVAFATDTVLSILGPIVKGTGEKGAGGLFPATISYRSDLYVDGAMVVLDPISSSATAASYGSNVLKLWKMGDDDVAI